MKPVHIRRAQPFDAGAMSALLTRLNLPVPRDGLRDWLAEGGVWHIAELDGDLLGFQWTGPRADLPPDACDIATFIDPARSDIAIGSALFAATRVASRAAGWKWVTATIHPDNIAAQSYYRSRSFETVRVPKNDLPPDAPVPPIRMIYRL